jgi:hypothetical protein
VYIINPAPYTWGAQATAAENEVALMRERLRLKQQKLLEKLALRKELQVRAVGFLGSPVGAKSARF